MSRSIRSVLKEKKGIAALEYSVLAGLIVIGVVAAISTTNIKASLTGVFDSLSESLDNAAAGNGTSGS